MKRILALGIALAALTACGGSDTPAADTAAPATVPAPSTTPAPTDSAVITPTDSAGIDTTKRADTTKTP